MRADVVAPRKRLLVVSIVTLVMAFTPVQATPADEAAPDSDARARAFWTVIDRTLVMREAASRWAEQENEARHSLRVWGFRDHGPWQTHWTETRNALRTELQQAREVGNGMREFDLLWHLAIATEALGEDVEVLRSELAATGSYTNSEGATCLALGYAMLLAHEWNTSDTAIHLEDAAELLREAGYPFEAGLALAGLGDYCRFRADSNCSDPSSYYQSALQTFEEIGDGFSAARVQSKLAEIQEGTE